MYSFNNQDYKDSQPYRYPSLHFERQIFIGTRFRHWCSNIDQRILSLPMPFQYLLKTSSPLRNHLTMPYTIRVDLSCLYFAIADTRLDQLLLAFRLKVPPHSITTLAFPLKSQF
jgi:hypothetical protein